MQATPHLATAHKDRSTFIGERLWSEDAPRLYLAVVSAVGVSGGGGVGPGSRGP